MQKADVIVSLLSQKARTDEHFVFRRLYRHFFNPDFYLSAYKRIQGRKSQQIEETADVANIVNSLIEKMRTETYHPKPIDNGFTLEDKLVQAGLRQILAAIYEPRFLETSHGFRPKRSHLSALAAIKATSYGIDWIITGNLKNIYDSIDHGTLIQLLARQIGDGRLLELVRRFLRAGYLEGQQVTFSIRDIGWKESISSLLLNIYLHELDRFITQSIKAGQVRITGSMEQLPGQTEDTNGHMVAYARYGENFLIGMAGPKAAVETIRNEIQAFLKHVLQVEADKDQYLLTNPSEEPVRFLDYEIIRSKRNSSDVKTTAGSEMLLLVPGDVIRAKIRPFSRNGKPIHHNARIHFSIPDLIRRYNAEIRGLYRYYCMAADVNAKLGMFRYYHYHSLVKTIARKEKRSVKQVLDKYGIEVKRKQGGGSRKIIGVNCRGENGTEEVLTYFNEPLKQNEYLRSAISIRQ